MRDPRSIGVGAYSARVVFHSCAVEPLRIANWVSGEELYRWSFASEDGAQAVCSNGSVTLVHGGLADLPKCDQIFVLSGIHMRDHVSRPLLAALRRERARGTAIGALCSGAWLLAHSSVAAAGRLRCWKKGK